MKQGCDLTGDLLKAVSRSFYLTIFWLPGKMRPGVALGYMLARATDSVADTSNAELEERLDILQSMGRAIDGTAAPDELRDLLDRLCGAMADAQSNPSERKLLQNFGACLTALDSFPLEQQRSIRKVLATIIEGQLWDISYFRQNKCVQSDDDTLLYTYRVAGCVGEFWTELGYITMGSAFSNPDNSELMRQAGIRYGRGLQLINILRDQAEDWERGRAYLCSDAGKWLSRAGYYMNDGIDYCRRLRGFRLRFASVLPALIGLKTIALLRRARPEDGRVKIPRRTVYACMLKAAWLSIVARVS